MAEVLIGLLLALPLGGAALAPLLAFLHPRLPRMFALGAGVAEVLIALQLLLQTVAEGPIRYAMGGWPGPWGIELRLDPLNGLLILLVALMALLGAASRPLEEETPAGGGHPVREGLLHGAVLLLLAGLVGILATRDLFNLFVFLEISSLAAYILIAGGGHRAAVAAFRYLLVGTAAGSLYLLGAGFLYAVSGTLNLDDLAVQLASLPGESAPAAAVGVVLIAVGLALKAALFPLHGWLPDTYAHAPVAAAGFIAAVMAKVSAFALLRTVGGVLGEGAAGPAAAGVLEVVLWLGVAGTLAGGVLAVAQENVIRMLAWSSVGAMGTILLGVAIGSDLAVAGAVMHMVAHGLAKGALFFGAGSLRFEWGLKRIGDWAGLGARAPVLAAALSVAALSLIGLPPAAGFVSKYLLLSSAWAAGDAAGIAAFLALLVSSLLGATYFLRLLEAIWFRRAESGTSGEPLPGAITGAAVVLAVLTLLLGVLAGPFQEHVLPS